MSDFLDKIEYQIIAHVDHIMLCFYTIRVLSIGAEIAKLQNKVQKKKTMPKFYGAARWAPKLILLQMLCMQVRCTHCTDISSI